MGNIKSALLFIFIVFAVLMTVTGINDYIETRDSIDIFLIILFVILIIISVKKLSKKFIHAKYNIALNRQDRLIEKQKTKLLSISNSLDQFKANYCNLSDSEHELYKNALNAILEFAKNMANTVNTTTETKVFIDSYIALENALEVLAKHEYTGYFINTFPSDNLNTIRKNKYLTELKFIRRSYKKSDGGGYDFPHKGKKYLSFFTPQGINFINTGLECAQQNTTMPDFDCMEGHNFEHFCADLLQGNGYTNVDVTKGSGDQGIDVIACKEGIKYGIQCKCYSSDVGNKAVQEAYAGKAFYNCHVAVVLTNRHFTSSAKDLAEKSGVLLWDREKMLELVNNANPKATD